MDVKPGSPEDAREMAKLYCQAFPASVEMFFGSKPAKSLLDLIELTFLLVFAWGGQAMLVKDKTMQIHGYCLYLDAHRRERKWCEAFRLVARLAARISLTELVRLLRNQLMMNRSALRTKKLPKHKGEIMSIAISPASQGQGLGTKLLQEVLRRLTDQPVILNVRADNEPGKHLYKAAGFSACGTAKDLLGEWIIMIKLQAV
ncbi:MAG: GNAT family N-acetyltransferase [Firmicutes bacterium]|nr:GNAT family N-acetyltransferase [Bacillota bacterium]